MEMAKVTSKGQITIPISIRRRLEINEGEKLLFIDSPDGVVMVNPDKLQPGREKALLEAEESVAAPAPHKGDKQQTPLKEKSPPAAGKPAEETHMRSAAPQEPVVEESAQTTSEYTPVAEPVPTAAAKPEQKIRGLDIGALLDEIRSIGTNTLK